VLETLAKIAVGYIICKVLSGGGEFLENLFHHASYPSQGPKPGPAPSSTTTVVNFPTTDPAGLPPWPSGWKPTQTNNTIVQRAYALLSTLQTGEKKVEMGPRGKWLTYFKSKMPNGKTGVTVFEPKEQTSIAPVPS
jgi:hypothetical protein